MRQYSYRRIFFRKPFAIALTAIIILLAFLLFVRKITYISVPDSYESVYSGGIKENVKVYFNSFGIPAVEANNEHDLFFATGYLHARDRLWQMDLIRRATQGNLSEIFGKDLFKTDILLRALEITAKTAGNTIVEDAVMETRESIQEGKTIAEPLKSHPVFPPMVVQMVAIGEATGALDDMLTKIADFYDEEVDQAVEALTSAIEPVMIVFLGGVVGGMVISMYMPMFSLIGGMSDATN